MCLGWWLWKLCIPIFRHCWDELRAIISHSYSRVDPARALAARSQLYFVPSRRVTTPKHAVTQRFMRKKHDAPTFVSSSINKCRIPWRFWLTHSTIYTLPCIYSTPWGQIYQQNLSRAICQFACTSHSIHATLSCGAISHIHWLDERVQFILAVALARNMQLYYLMVKKILLLIFRGKWYS